MWYTYKECIKYPEREGWETEHKPQRQLLTIWRVALAICAFIPAFIISLILEAPGAAWLALAALWLLLFLALYLIYLPMCFRALSFKIEGNTLIRRGGVVYSSTRSLPFSSIQYVTVTAAPLERIFGLRSLVAAAPGGRIVISGLTPKKAEELASAIMGDCHGD